MVIDIWESEILWNKQKVIDIIRSATGVCKQSPSDELLSEVEWVDLLKKVWTKERKQKIPPEPEIKICKCGKNFQVKSARERKSRKFCSTNCYRYYSRKIERPSLAQLQIDIKVLGSITKVSKKYGVSGKAIAKWIKSYGHETHHGHNLVGRSFTGSV